MKRGSSAPALREAIVLLELQMAGAVAAILLKVMDLVESQKLCLAQA